jgi:predicted ABC-type ATPase
MKYAQLVVGPAGSGKSSYCHLIQEHCRSVHRPVFVINLDPAAEAFKYECDVGELTFLIVCILYKCIF